MGIKLKKIVKYAAIGAAVYFGAPYLAAAASAATPYISVAGQLLAGRGRMSGSPGGGATVQAGGGQPIIITGGGGGYPGMDGGGTMSQVYPAFSGGGGAPAGPSGLSPGLLVGLIAGGFGLVVLMVLLRR